ncbi:hypothetical protein ACOMHN_063981 [Nucella lapillus]
MVDDLLWGEVGGHLEVRGVTTAGGRPGGRLGRLGGGVKCWGGQGCPLWRSKGRLHRVNCGGQGSAAWVMGLTVEIRFNCGGQGSTVKVVVDRGKDDRLWGSTSLLGWFLLPDGEMYTDTADDQECIITVNDGDWRLQDCPTG